MQNPHLAEETIGELTDTLLRWSADFFAAAGCANDSVTYHNLSSAYGPQVSRIARSIAKLSQVVREDVMSTTFELMAVEHTDAFDSDIMDDTFREYAPSDGAVLATTELGLRCKTRISTSDYSNDAPSEAAFESRVLLRPKIILESALQIMDNE